jgi:hypothetical protein
MIGVAVTADVAVDSGVALRSASTVSAAAVCMSGGNGVSAPGAPQAASTRAAIRIVAKARLARDPFDRILIITIPFSSKSETQEIVRMFQLSCLSLA